jgi:glycosyltransferase involved in cell wall biosynthesis
MRTLYQGCIRATRRKLREIDPDLVHGQGTERDCSISGVLSGFPCVMTIHGNMRVMARLAQSPPLSFHWLAARLESFTLPRALGVICITNYTRHEVESLNPRTWVVPNAVDASFFGIEPAPVDGPTILCVGNICPRKNQNAFIQALDGLAPEGSFRIVFLGASNPADSYFRDFLELTITRPWCNYMGFTGRDSLKNWLGKATALILPSLEDNCPMVVLEAMAAGVPVAAGRVGGVPDLIREGETGLLFDPSQAREMREATAQLLSGDPSISNRALQAKKEALDRFHPQVIARRHVEIYESVLASIGRPSHGVEDTTPG